MSEKLDRMSSIDWTAQIEFIAGPYGGNRKSWLSRAARRSGATVRQIKALYYGECRDPKVSVALMVMTAADRARVEKATRNASELANIYRTAAQSLDNIDPDFHRNDITALVDAARILGALGGSGIKGQVK